MAKTLKIVGLDGMKCQRDAEQRRNGTTSRRWIFNKVTFVCERKSHQVWFSCRPKSYPA